MNEYQTLTNPVALSFTILMCIVILIAKKDYIIIPFILVACFITTVQGLVIFGMNFSMLRIIIIIGLLRIAIRHDQSSMTLNSIDKIMIAWTIIRILSYTILWSSSSAFIFMLGQSVDILGAYFFIRLAINDFKEYDLIIKTLIVSSIILASFMMYEKFSGGRNLFSILGGVPEWDEIRMGRLRAQGAFSHSILAGTFGATMLPLSWGLWQRNYKVISILGFISSLIITLASASSGPIAAFAAGIFGIFFWRFNKYTKISVYLLWVMIICLHLVMKGPVWHLIGRMDFVGGSTGYHRYRLIDAAITNFSDWFAFGIRSTGVWGWGLQDITNQFILEGARGGIIGLILFLIIVKKCFHTIGKTRIKMENQLYLQKFIWALGVTLFTQVLSFVSVSYFGQIVSIYYLLIAMISSLNNMSSINENTI